MPSVQDAKALEEQLALYKSNLAALEMDVARRGGLSHASLELRNNIDETRAAISSIYSELAPRIPTYTELLQTDDAGRIQILIKQMADVRALISVSAPWQHRVTIVLTVSVTIEVLILIALALLFLNR